MVDELDHRIVDALVQDGRRPFVRIAADLGVSEASVRQRVARLTADGVMQIMAVTKPLKLGVEGVCLLGGSVEKREMEGAGRGAVGYSQGTYLGGWPRGHDHPRAG